MSNSGIRGGAEQAEDAYLDEHPNSDIGKEEHFWTKEEAIAFCSGLK